MSGLFKKLSSSLEAVDASVKLELADKIDNSSALVFTVSKAFAWCFLVTDPIIDPCSLITFLPNHSLNSFFTLLFDPSV